MLLTPDVFCKYFFFFCCFPCGYCLFFSNPYFYLSDSLFPLLHLPVLFYTYSCCVPYFILDSVVFVYFPSLFLFNSLESHISLSTFSIRNRCPFSHHHRYCTNFLFFFYCFLANFLYTHSWGSQKCSWYPTFLSSPIAWFYHFTSLAAIDLGC